MTKITQEMNPHDILLLWAPMLFPEDDAAMKQFLTVERLHRDLLNAKDADPIDTDAFTIKVLLDAPAYTTLREEVENRTKQGIMAGNVLAIMYLMNRFNLREPSMNKAVFIAEEYAKKIRYGDGSKINASERMIRKYWKQFMPVAHLWAAFQLNQVYPFAPTKEPLSHEGGMPFLQAAKGLYDFGTTFIPIRARDLKPILDEDVCWKLQDNISPAILTSDREPNEIINILKRYKAPAHTG